MTLPYLIDGEKVISESNGIAVYICHRGNKPELLGRNADEHVQIATVQGVFKDFHSAYIKLVYSPYTQEKTFESALQEAIKNFEPYMKKFDGLLGNQQFIAGNLTWIDFVVADFLQTLGLLSE